MERAKIILIAAFVLIGSILVFVFRYKEKKDQANKNMMAEVRAAKGLKKYVQSDDSNDDEKIKDSTLEKSE